MKKCIQSMPFPVKRVLLKIGLDIRNARLRRRIQIELLAERASIARSTLHKIEKGNPGVSMGSYATVLFALGLLDKLAVIADVVTDKVGLDLDEEQLPKRIRYPRNPKTPVTDDAP